MARPTAILVALLTTAEAPMAADWPQWRGPNRDGRAALAERRTAWPAALRPGWKVTVGLGHSSPIVQDGRVYLFSREGDEEVAAAFELATGKRLWRQSYPTPYTMNPAATGHGKGPKSTPVWSGGRLYTFGIAGTVSCFEAAAGKLVWRRDFQGQHRSTAPLYGVALSPLVDKGLLILHVGGHDDGALLALDVATGATRWAWKGSGPGYASPVVAELGGTRQVILQTQTHLAGLDAARGALLWSVPITTPYDQNAITPVVHGQTVIYSGLEQGIRAVRVVPRGGSWATEEAWRNGEVSMYLSSPVLEGGLLYGFSHRHKGEFFCLEAETGRLRWRSEGRQGENAALVAAGRDLLLLTDEAKLTVVRLGADGFVPLATFTVAASPTWAHPVPTEQGLLIKDVDSLALWNIE